jgi:hypothetical protein
MSRVKKKNNWIRIITIYVYMYLCIFDEGKINFMLSFFYFHIFSEKLKK